MHGQLFSASFFKLFIAGRKGEDSVNLATSTACSWSYKYTLQFFSPTVLALYCIR